MTKTIDLTADQITEAADRIDINVDVRTDYSGRGMYGETCFGIVTGSPEQVGLTFALALIAEGTNAEDAITTAADLMGHAAKDNMGYDTIIYFPRYTLTDDA